MIDEPSAPRSAVGPRLIRYRVMAYVTGCFLLLLTTEIIVKYGFNHGHPWLGTWVAITHGWIYVVYLLTVFDLWSKMRWRLGRLVLMALAGVVPFLSFFAERRITAAVVRESATAEAGSARGSR